MAAVNYEALCQIMRLELSGFPKSTATTRYRIREDRLTGISMDSGLQRVSVARKTDEQVNVRLQDCKRVKCAGKTGKQVHLWPQDNKECQMC